MLEALPGGTTLMVALTDKISSGTAKVGDTFSIRAVSDVVLDGYVVIAKDAGGQGEIPSYASANTVTATNYRRNGCRRTR